MLNANTNSSDNPEKWNGHIEPEQFTLRNRGGGVEFKIIVNDGVPNDDDDQLPTSWKAIGKGFENHLNKTIRLTLSGRDEPINNLMEAMVRHSDDARDKTELTVNGECVGYLYQQNNTNAFGQMLVYEGHIRQSSFSRYFENTSIGQKHVFCLYNPKSYSFLFLARMSKCVYHRTDKETGIIMGLCADKLRKSINHN